jgi:hypothetical protein
MGLAMIVPSRGRPQAVRELVDAFAATVAVGDTRLVWAVDRDDPDLRRYRAAVTKTRNRQVTVHAVEGGTMVAALNEAALLLARDDPTVEAAGFLGDDHRPRTPGWDAAFLTALREPGCGLVYGDDLYSSDFVPTHIAMRTSIVRALGWMVHPSLRHMYVDTLWRDMGNAAGALRYLKNASPERTVIVEHMHYQCGKAVEDEAYRRVNAPEVYAADEQAFRELHASGEIARAANVICSIVGGAP